MKSEPIIDCFCLWSDLLGFGRTFEEGGWSFSSDKVRNTAQRLADIERMLFQSNAPTQEYVFLLNDGVARNLDWPHPLPGYSSGVLHWLQSVLTNHWQINAIEKQNGHPGMRSVLCSGQRMDLRKATKSSLSQVLASQSMAERLDQDISVYSPRQFQMNLAFAKAYLLEGLGSKAGLAGPNFFIEDRLFHDLVQICMNEQVVMPTGKLEYHATTVNTDDRAVFSVIGDAGGKRVLRFAIESDAKVIEVNYRGIAAKLHKATRFQPMDENDSFWFDFCGYNFESSVR
jgi:hypothetical protein